MMKHERNINISGRRINLREITFKKYRRRYKLQKNIRSTEIFLDKAKIYSFYLKVWWIVLENQ